MQTQPMSPGGAADAFHTWTIIGLIGIAIAAAIVVAGIIYGRRQAAARHRAEEAALDRAEEAGAVETRDEDAVAVESVAEPAAGEPDADSPIAEPEPEPAPKPEPAAARNPASAPGVPPEPAREPASPPPTPPADLAGALALTTIKGLGPKVAAMLAERGITRVDQLAALNPDQASDLDVQLGAFTGRMGRDRWIDQAKLLASGDTAAYEAEFGKLG